ncbi:preprotein translocase subunit SecE [Kurthia sibirica]|uniref:Protein translocase subunit SecE n=1 Tax=Kurthia sibirica TaxID=202750 RepID=A0A2U3AM81_9BACL|nr:preprotein translocase subunit SecE [Kurthia sibirica]PWI25642.1 preprotein translocase subunit SecE [Kurthia sibirica]GEK34058.1 protein translocase subunit SecE [Kurthia sibirica]
MAKIKQFLKNVLSEMRKTSWPKRKELSKYTLVVISTLIFMAAFFMLVDSGVSKLFRMYLDL